MWSLSCDVICRATGSGATQADRDPAQRNILATSVKVVEDNEGVRKLDSDAKMTLNEMLGAHNHWQLFSIILQIALRMPQALGERGNCKECPNHSTPHKQGHV